jgi:pullulanase/glycogen debranching enzyme
LSHTELSKSGLSIKDIADNYGNNFFGCHVVNGSTIFRVFCPRSPLVTVELFDSYTDSDGRSILMKNIGSGVWELIVQGDLSGKFYGYRITSPTDNLPFSRSDFAVADPYSYWVVTRQNYRQNPLTKIIRKQHFDWQNDDFVTPSDLRDLIIYEVHIKDITGRLKDTYPNKSWYQRFLAAGETGGIEYLKKLGINAVEFLPIQKFAYEEPPYNSLTPEGYRNTWNPYATNYWGYMTSFFFMPESIYAEKSVPSHQQIYGTQDNAIDEFKTIVRELHKNGISVILDVVYNHVSQYDYNPLKYLDRTYYFRHDHQGNLTSESGCGNDLKTESPLARKLIIDSILYWMKEFHIDGFRFDLAHLIDRETLISIREEARKINPDVILIAEPWGGGYNPTAFSEIGWSSWNDQIRNGVKGSDPVHDPGFIFGCWQRETSRLSLENFVRGTILNAPNGRFHRSSHSVNYLESHDGYTIADFIRIYLNNRNPHHVFSHENMIGTLEGVELNIARLSALFLMVSQGVTMIHAGQEIGRGKVIEATNITDPEAGRLDHNSYNKDNNTNYINWNLIRNNAELFKYYSGLIKLRRNSPALRKARPDSIAFRNYQDALHLTFSIRNHGTTDPFEYFIILNGNQEVEHTVELPDGFWQLMVSETVASHVPISVISGIVKIRPVSGMVFRRLARQSV